MPRSDPDGGQRDAHVPRWPSIGGMHLPRGREEFVVQATALGSMFEILNFA